MVTHTADSECRLSACVTQHPFEPIFCLFPSLFRLGRGCLFLLPLPFTALLLFLEGCSGAALRLFIYLSGRRGFGSLTR